MRRMLRMALVAALAGPAIAAGADSPPGELPFPSGQYFPGAYPTGGPSTQGGAAGAYGPGGAAMPGGAAATNPDGTPIEAPAAPGAEDAGAAALAASAAAGGASPGLGGFAGGSGAPPGVIGDMSPISRAQVVTSPVHALQSVRFPNLPSPLPPPVVKGNNPGVVSGNGTSSVLFKFTGLKIADNQSPIPQDRIFYSFNYFDNVNASLNAKIGSPVQNLQVYHQLFGLEKTFLDGRASIGFRLPLNTISLHPTANLVGLGGSSTAPGDLSIFMKYVLYKDDNCLFSGGIQVTPPTGPGAFGGKKYYSYFRDTQIQPFLGYLFTRDRFYLQGFTSVVVPTTSQDVTILFNDVAIGYYVYRANDPRNFLTALVPTAEVHVTTPLNHRGFSASDLASTSDVVDMTFGANMEMYRRAILTAAYVTPVTGPKPFNAELVLLLNIKFGGSARNRSSIIPPPLAQ